MQSKKAESESDESKVLEVARQRFDLAAEAESEQRDGALDDLKFGLGEQWDPRDKSQREQERRPCLTINRLPQYNRQITNDQRQNRPAIKVSPVDDQADIETAKIFQGIIRNIENVSDADIAYDTAFDCAARARWGYFRILTAYSDPLSFDQDILIAAIKNKFGVYVDPSYKKPDGSDMNWGFIFDDIPKDEYETAYPDSKLCSMDDWSSIGDQREGWVSKDTARVAEYFYKEIRDVTLVKFAGGDTLIKEDLSEMTQLPLDEMGMPQEVIAERKSRIPVIKWLKINGVEILEETEWLGRWIPIIPVLGEEVDVQGKRMLKAVITDAKDSQRMLNYMKSAEAETIALAPKAPWIVAEGQIEGYEAIWKSANTRAHSALPYKPVSLNGVPVPPPQRNTYEPAIQAITQASMMASEDLKATTGIYDAAMGAQSNEKSGIAIQRRANQSQTSNFHFTDNLSRSIRHCGRQLVDLIPKVYDTARAVRILSEEGEQEIVRINQIFERNGKQVQYNLGIGKYDVTVHTGPSYQTKRQEAAASMLELARSAPNVMQLAPDLVVKNLDLPGAQELAERLKKGLPPGIADDPKKQKVPPELQAQMQQMGTMIDGLTAKLTEATDKLENKTLELESKERIAMQELQVKLEIEMAKIDAKDAITLLSAEIAQIESRMKLLRVNEPIPIEQKEFAPSGPAGAAMQGEQQATGGSAPGEFVE